MSQGMRRLMIIVPVLGLSAGCGKPVAVISEPPDRPVKLATAEATGPREVYRASGRIKARQRAELSFDRSDVLAELPVTQGQQVEQGDVLARLDTRDLTLMEQARAARFEEARLQHERMTRLFERGAIAEVDLERALAAYETARADLMQVRQDIASSELRAPFSGRVATIMADRYQVVQPKQPILVVHDLSSYEVQIDIPESFIIASYGSTGSSAIARFDHLPDRTFPVEVKEYATEADPQTLTYTAVFSLPPPPGTVILPGMSVTIEIAVPAHDREPGLCWIPAAAIFSADGSSTEVWRINPADMTAERRMITTGPTRNGRVRVLEGLEPGDLLAVSGLHHLTQGQRVRPYHGEPGA